LDFQLFQYQLGIIRSFGQLSWYSFGWNIHLWICLCPRGTLLHPSISNFLHDVDDGLSKRSYLGIEAGSTFWWWQYVWLLLCMVPYMVEALTNLVPSITTRLFTSRNDYIQSFLNILFPISRLYTAKEMHESFKYTSVYGFFWATLIAGRIGFAADVTSLLV
jgi:hypothetical protein